MGDSKTHLFFSFSFVSSFLSFLLLIFLWPIGRSDTVWELSWSPGFGGFEVGGNKDEGSYITTLNSEGCGGQCLVGMGWGIHGRNKSDGSGLREDYVRSFWRKEGLKQIFPSSVRLWVSLKSFWKAFWFCLFLIYTARITFSSNCKMEIWKSK